MSCRGGQATIFRSTGIATVSPIRRRQILSSSLLWPDESARAARGMISSVALTSVLDELIPAFEKASGNKLNIGYGLAAELKKRILDGEMADVIIDTAVSPPSWLKIPSVI
jgi:ABC-type tungstate transport system permease subunit